MSTQWLVCVPATMAVHICHHSLTSQGRQGAADLSHASRPREPHRSLSTAAAWLAALRATDQPCPRAPRHPDANSPSVFMQAWHVAINLVLYDATGRATFSRCTGCKAGDLSVFSGATSKKTCVPCQSDTLSTDIGPKWFKESRGNGACSNSRAGRMVIAIVEGLLSNVHHTTCYYYVYDSFMESWR
jgi:hypothetical protein